MLKQVRPRFLKGAQTRLVVWVNLERESLWERSSDGIVFPPRRYQLRDPSLAVSLTFCRPNIYRGDIHQKICLQVSVDLLACFASDGLTKWINPFRQSPPHSLKPTKDGASRSTVKNVSFRQQNDSIKQLKGIRSWCMD